jgi:hypothetical protein
MDLAKLQNELKKRWFLPFNWHYKFDPKLDYEADFIFSTQNFDKILTEVERLSENKHQYVLNRWYNFWCERAVIQIFSQHDKVSLNDGQLARSEILLLHKTPFILKSYIYPNQFAKTFRYALLHKEELIYWLYRRSKRENRSDPKNFIFLLFYRRDGEHWKMKAEILLLERLICHYLDPLDIQKVTHLHFFNNKTSYSDLIWCVQQD